MCVRESVCEREETRGERERECVCVLCERVFVPKKKTGACDRDRERGREREIGREREAAITIAKSNHTITITKSNLTPQAVSLGVAPVMGTMRVCVREGESACVLFVCERVEATECVCVCVRERERGSVCVCLICERESERERDRESEG